VTFVWVLILAALPMPGTQFQQLPPGNAKANVEAACYTCHSADLIAQQRLTRKQWTATVEKMTRWGAAVPPEKKDAIVDYLAKNFGPKGRFVPLKVGTVRR